jgi:branched-chain amino acid aminotransferase
MQVDEALMLDLRGFVKTCNSVNFFIVRGDEVWAPTKDNQMQGITRQKTIDVCRANGIVVKELDFSLTEVYGADEAFCTGTFPSQMWGDHAENPRVIFGFCTKRRRKIA